MIKKIIASTVVAGALTLSSLAATASPVSFESVSRTGSAVSAAEGQDDDGGISDGALVAGFIIIGGVIIYVLGQNGDSIPDLPTSP